MLFRSLLPGWMQYGTLGLLLKGASAVLGPGGTAPAPLPPMDTRKPLPATGAGAGRGSVNPGGPVAINVYPSPAWTRPPWPA